MYIFDSHQIWEKTFIPAVRFKEFQVVSHSYTLILVSPDAENHINIVVCYLALIFSVIMPHETSKNLVGMFLEAISSLG